MISSKLIQENKQKLLLEQQHLEQLLKKVARPNPAVAGDYQATYPDFGDKSDENAIEVAEYEANIAEERDLEEKMRRVTAALERIEQGTYGRCAACGEAIPEQRLRAVPEAETCVEHES